MNLALRRARFVAGLSDEQLSRFERGPARRVIVRAAALALPRKFKNDIGRDIDGVLELRFAQPDGGAPDRIQLVMRHGRCRATVGGTARPDAAATIRIPDLFRLAAACVDAGWLVADGRVTVSGDPFLFIRFPAAFGLPTRPVYVAQKRGLTLAP
jgi:hypothetical protein